MIYGYTRVDKRSDAGDATAAARRCESASDPTSDRRRPEDGGHDRDRTCDPYHVKVVLSR